MDGTFRKLNFDREFSAYPDFVRDAWKDSEINDSVALNYLMNITLNGGRNVDYSSMGFLARDGVGMSMLKKAEKLHKELTPKIILWNVSRPQNHNDLEEYGRQIRKYVGKGKLDAREVEDTLTDMLKNNARISYEELSYSDNDFLGYNGRRLIAFGVSKGVFSEVEIKDIESRLGKGCSIDEFTGKYQGNSLAKDTLEQLLSYVPETNRKLIENLT